MIVIMLAIFGIFCIGALLNPNWALALLLLLYPMKQAMQGSSQIFIDFQTLPNYAIGIVVVMSLVLNWVRGKISFAGYLNPIWITFVAGYIYSAISYLWTPSKDTSFVLITDGIPYFFMFIVIAPILLHDLKDWNRVLSVAALFGLFAAIMILVSPAFNLKGGRFGIDLTSKIRSSPLAIGELGGFLILTAALLVTDRRRYWVDALRAMTLICGVILSVFSGSRGQFFFSVFLAIVYFPLSRPIKNLFQFFLLSFGSIGLLGVIAVVGSFLVGDVDVANRWLNPEKADAAVEVRAANITDLLNGFMHAPSSWLMGLGHNAFTSVSGSTEPYSHAMFLDVLVEMGLVAFIVLIACYWSIVVRAIELIRMASENQQLRSAAVVLVALCTYQVMLMNKQGELWSSQHTVVYFLLLARVSSAMRLEWESDEHAEEPADPHDEHAVAEGSLGVRA